jgi:hypothetical protein
MKDNNDIGGIPLLSSMFKLFKFKYIVFYFRTWFSINIYIVAKRHHFEVSLYVASVVVLECGLYLTLHQTMKSLLLCRQSPELIVNLLHL